MLGDGMTNLRDSLDHLIYQISTPNLDKPQYRKAAFVIVRDSKDFKKEANNKLAGVSKKKHALQLSLFNPTTGRITLLHRRCWERWHISRIQTNTDCYCRSLRFRRTYVLISM